jgi:hypothetical protein
VRGWPVADPIVTDGREMRRQRAANAGRESQRRRAKPAAERAPLSSFCVVRLNFETHDVVWTHYGLVQGPMGVEPKRLAEQPSLFFPEVWNRNPDGQARSLRRRLAKQLGISMRAIAIVEGGPVAAVSKQAVTVEPEAVPLVRVEVDHG